MLLTGKVYEAVRRGAKQKPNAYDAVVLDAPPTGRIAQFLNVHEAVSGLAKVGPIRNQADSIMRVLRSATTVVHLVTLLEDMPVTETEEAVAALRPTQIRVGAVIENMVITSPLSAEQLDQAAAGKSDHESARADGRAERRPGRGVRDRGRPARSHQQQRHDRLTELALPLVQIDFDPGEIDEGAIFAIADQLTDQLSLEAA